MALGKIADKNYALDAALSGGVWSPALPLANLLTDRRFVAAPARQLEADTLASSQLEATLDRARTVNLVALLFHTLSAEAKYRVTVAGTEGDLEEPIFETGWKPVYERLYASMNLPWEDSNWWTGQAVAEDDLALYPRHLWISLPAGLITKRVRVEIDDQGHPAGFFDIGGLWITQTWSPAINFERGRQPAVEARDQGEEGPSGRLFPEERAPRRRHQLSWNRLTDAEAQRLFDAGARARTTRTVLVLPDTDDPAMQFREAFPAVFDPLPKPTYRYSGLNEVTAGFKEIIA